LTEIRGIGPAYQQRLYDAGLFTWQQIAEHEPDALRQLAQALPTSDPQSWIDQARRLVQDP
jgi:1,4-alpha-glucan branching enzyme